MTSLVSRPGFGRTCPLALFVALLVLAGCEPSRLNAPSAGHDPAPPTLLATAEPMITQVVIEVDPATGGIRSVGSLAMGGGATLALVPVTGAQVSWTARCVGCYDAPNLANQTLIVDFTVNSYELSGVDFQRTAAGDHIAPMICINCTVVSAVLEGPGGVSLPDKLGPGSRFRAVLEVDAFEPRKFTVQFFLYGEEVAAVEPCQCDKVSKSLVYSRGNNDEAQIRRQFMKVGKYMYQTGRLDLAFTADPAKTCYCKGTQCDGAFELQVVMKIVDLLNPADQPGIPEPTGFALLNGVEVAGGTTRVNRNPPAPQVETNLVGPMAPAAAPANKFKKPDATKRNYEATAKTEVPCKPGTYNRRFFIKDAGFGGGAIDAGSSTFYVDAKITVEDLGNCRLRVRVQGDYLEFVRNYAWAPAAATGELPKIKWVLGAANGNEFNIAKLITEDGAMVDNPYPARAP